MWRSFSCTRRFKDGKNSRDWDSFSRELDRISLWSKKDNSTKDGHQESSPTGLHTFFLSLFSFLLLCSSWSPPMPLCLRQLVSESALMATYGHTHSPRWPSPVFPSSAPSPPPPLTWVHPHLLNYSVEFKQNIPGIWGTSVKGERESLHLEKYLWLLMPRILNMNWNIDEPK